MWLRPTLLAAIALLGGCECGDAPPPPPGAAPSAPVEPRPDGHTRVRVSPERKVPRACRVQCRIMGHCTWEAEAKRCIASSDEDCRQSRGCRVNGLCTATAGGCAGSSDEDCRASERCRNEGLCHYRGVGATNCRAKTDADCKASAQCKSTGKCTHHEGRCVIEIPKDQPLSPEEAADANPPPP